MIEVNTGNIKKREIDKESKLEGKKGVREREKEREKGR